MKYFRPTVAVLCAIVATMSTTGCVAKHGVDFGHWALTAERRQLVRVSTAPDASLLKTSTIAILPVLGPMPAETAERFRTQFALNLQDHIPLNLVMPSGETANSPLLQQDNLVETGAPRLLEIAGAGKIFDTSHVLCIAVTDYSAYPPQKLYFQAWLVKTADASLASTFQGCFDASEQQTVMAVAAHMQSRRARKFDDTNLDIMLQSPSEFADFTCSYSARHIAQQMITTGLLPGSTTPATMEQPKQ